LCRKAIPEAHIHVIKNDQFTIHELFPYLNAFAAIIVGPGPGSPQNARDIGVVRDLWTVDHEHTLPIFGVCLGLQSLAIEHGAQLQKLSAVKHGRISSICHTGADLFQGVGSVQAVRYHSLHVLLADCCDLEELAYVEDEKDNGKVIMALKHKKKPFWAVQYHPESVLTVGGGSEVMCNFWVMAKQWNMANRDPPGRWTPGLTEMFGPSWPTVCLSPPHCGRTSTTRRKVTTKALDLPSIDSIAVAELSGACTESNSCVLLDSAAKPGRYSIIGFLSPSSLRIVYHVEDKFVTLFGDGPARREDLDKGDIWSWIAAFMETRLAEGGNRDIPFWGGLVGYLSYELGCTIFGSDVLGGRRAKHSDQHPDVNLVFVERSVVLDSMAGKAYAQSIIPEDEMWVNNIAKSVSEIAKKSSLTPIDKDESVRPLQSARIILPNQQYYLARIMTAKGHLAVGNSYELCLTTKAEAKISRPGSPLLQGSSPSSSSWELYKDLRKRNPAPHSAYIRLHPSTVLSSSPERFLSYSRPLDPSYQLRPIKGTLRKAPDIARADAERGLRGNAKEVAENLMIVDLIRHDLHGVVGENVVVKQFCSVEEYETVWQMVSVIEGKPSLGQIGSVPGFDHGWRALRNCLPPGSMTGAPKKRSVEILRDLEDEPRGIYSGVLGYWDVGGAGDWAVVIRSCFKHDDSSPPRDSGRCTPTFEEKLPESWIIGAGGAITALSDPESEWDEMVLKLQSVLGIFKGCPKL